MRVSGWHLQTVFHDPMHLICLGVMRDLYASALAYWIRGKFYGDHHPLDENLAQFSLEMKEVCKREQRLG